VKWTESVGLTLLKRDLNSMTLRTPDFRLMHFTILQMFPFTSESKRMGIVVRVLVSFFCRRESVLGQCENCTGNFEGTSANAGSFHFLA